MRILNQNGFVNTKFIYNSDPEYKHRIVIGEDTGDGVYSASGSKLIDKDGKVASTNGVSFSGAITNLTVVNGIVTAAS